MKRVGASDAWAVCRVLLALVLFATSFAFADGDAAGSRKTTDYSGFLPQIDLGNFKWCSNQPTGAFCEDLSRSCNQITSVPYSQGYYAYFEIFNLLHSNNYNYNIKAYA